MTDDRYSNEGYGAPKLERTFRGHEEPHLTKHTARYADSAAGALDEISRLAEHWRMLLATDLDGTFLGGEPGDRAILYRWIEKHRGEIGLVFVTGRDPAFIRDLVQGDVPAPDFVVGDVGTTIARYLPTPGGDVIPIEELERPIAEAWGDRGDEVRARLDGCAGLTLQPTDFCYRVSYDFDPKAYDGAAERIVAEMGLDPLISADRFFDVLPKGISKGPSLIRLVEHLNVPGERVLCAGDTMNDLTLFETGYPAVAVANAEPPLVERIGKRKHVLHAPTEGAGGIMDAIEHFDIFTPGPRGG